MILPREIYIKAYEILERYAGEAPWHKDDFFEYYTKKLTNNPQEYMLCGKLGNSSKFCNKDCKLYVTCREDDMTDERYAIIEKVNGLLQHLLEGYLNYNIY